MARRLPAFIQSNAIANNNNNNNNMKHQKTWGDFVNTKVDITYKKRKHIYMHTTVVYIICYN